MVLKLISTYVPVADPLVLNTCTLKLMDDGLLRTNNGCADPEFSWTLYVVWLNVMVTAKTAKIIHYVSLLGMVLLTYNSQVLFLAVKTR